MSFFSLCIFRDQIPVTLFMFRLCNLVVISNLQHTFVPDLFFVSTNSRENGSDVRIHSLCYVNIK